MSAPAPAAPRRPVALALLGALVVLLTAVAVACSPRSAGHPWLHIALFVGAGGAWALSLGALGRLPRTRGDLATLVVVALALRVPAWLAPPAHSDDVYRFAWDGRVARAGVNPYRYPPSSPALARLRDGDDASLATTPPPPADTDGAPPAERAPARPTSDAAPLYARINNADLPTLYPPAAQLLFLVAALLPLPPVVALELCVAACDLAVLALLVLLLRARGADPRRALAWGWAPLAAVELGQEVHVDALAIALLVAALVALERRRERWAGALVGLATAAKLVTAPLLLTAFRSWRARLAAAVAIALVALPFLSAGAAMVGSTGEFARRWRANDGLYALVQAATDRIVCRALHAPPIVRATAGPACDVPLDLWPHETIARAISGRPHRAAVYPDELSGFLARAVCGVALALVIVVVARRRLAPLAATEWTLGALLLLTPALHPWYALWLLPLAALTGRWAWVALAALVPLAYLPRVAWLDGAPWVDPVWSRVVEHGLVLLLLARDALRARREKLVRDFGASI